MKLTIGKVNSSKLKISESSDQTACYFYTFETLLIDQSFLQSNPSLYKILKTPPPLLENEGGIYIFTKEYYLPHKVLNKLTTTVTFL